MPLLYDQIGTTYTSTRAADPRITAGLVDLLALPSSARLLDIGAGTGNYSFALAEFGFRVTALEPSAIMRAQARAHPGLDWQPGVAEQLPFPDGSFDGAVMTLCLHHFVDWQQALREAIRVIAKGPLVIFGFDVEFPTDFWLFDYFPGFLTIDRNWSASIPTIREFAEQQLDVSFRSQPFPLPKDLKDHFAAAGWARPEVYFQESYRKGISSFSKLQASEIDSGLERLSHDLDSGAWLKKYGKLLALAYYDRGYLFMKLERCG